jgi:glycosyltransferase involved in cell wall biosynthesis
MIVKNEAAQLATCLASVQGADEIVVVDTGSTDATIALAQAHGATVYAGPEFAWRDDFAWSRNQSLDRCTGDWVLVIDADEELEPGGIAKVRAACAATALDALYFDTVAAGHPTQVHPSIRCFRRLPTTRWRGRCHNYLTLATGERTALRITYGHSPAHQADPDRALRILTAAVAEDPAATRERYYLAREHWYRGHWRAALAELDRYLARATWAPEMADAWLMQARCHAQLGAMDAARAACLRAIQINTNFHEALTLMAALSGPKNAARWRAWAATATNEDVLFIRSAPEANPCS